MRLAIPALAVGLGIAAVATFQKLTAEDMAAPTAADQSPVRAKALERQALDCGRVNGLKLTAGLAPGAVKCMQQARSAGKTATLWVDNQTPEGDPIPTIYWLNRDGTLSKTVDTRADALGPQQVTHARCVVERWIESSICTA